MCRIAGVIDFKNSLGKKLEEVTISMRDSMVYGGPDDAGLFMSNNKKVAFGNRRLSIIDLSSNGHQPMSNKTKTIWITYNGEIYNFRELRKELQQEGCTFLSGSDTEVIVNGYEQWGIEKLISKLRGMFAFAIYDERDVINGHKLYLVRDRFGIKPLYYYHSDKYLIFASEVKAIAGCGLISQEENIDAMVKFLQLGSIPVPLTTIKNVYSIPASHYLELKNENITIKRYWNISQVFKSSTNNMKYGDVVELIKSTLDKVMQLHLISDAPLGVFLSGGLDSSALCAIASKYQQNPLVTLSLVFEENSFSEAKYSRLVAKKFNTNHNEITLTEKDFMDEIPSIISAMDQPTVDGVNTYFISKAAKDIGLKVVLSGIGADEVFLGYSHFRKAKMVNNILQLFYRTPGVLREVLVNGIAGLNRKFEKLQFITEPSNNNAYFLFRGLFTPKQIQQLTGISKKELRQYGSAIDLDGCSSMSGSLTEDFNILEFWHYLQDQILKDTDFMSMFHSVEVRVPFLDHMLVEQVISNALNMRLGRVNKLLLVDAVKEYLPNEIVSRPKMGFVFPFNKWFQNSSSLFKEQCLNNKFLNDNSVHKIWDDVKDGKLHWSRGWALFVLSELLNSGKKSLKV